MECVQSLILTVLLAVGKKGVKPINVGRPSINKGNLLVYVGMPR